MEVAGTRDSLPVAHVTGRRRAESDSHRGLDARPIQRTVRPSRLVDDRSLTQTLIPVPRAPIGPTGWLFLRGRTCCGAEELLRCGDEHGRRHLRRIVPGALRLTVARLPGYTVRWHKRAGSEGKLAAYETSNAGDAAWGVVYQLSPADFQLIDDAQRRARYVENHVRVIDKDGNQHEATVYVAEAGVIDDSLKPTRSYRDQS